MKMVCPQCKKEVGEVTAATRLNLSVHCPFDGFGFGVVVEPVVSPDEPSAPTAKETVAGA